MCGGFVANYTLSTDFCHQADLQALEGIFVEPRTSHPSLSPLPLSPSLHTPKQKAYG